MNADLPRLNRLAAVWATLAATAQHLLAQALVTGDAESLEYGRVLRADREATDACLIQLTHAMVLLGDFKHAREAQAQRQVAAGKDLAQAEQTAEAEAADHARWAGTWTAFAQTLTPIPPA
jgi:endonuclease/exonuclease/phosphatase family metal-dependent hydrolase